VKIGHFTKTQNIIGYSFNEHFPFSERMKASASGKVRNHAEILSAKAAHDSEQNFTFGLSQMSYCFASQMH